MGQKLIVLLWTQTHPAVVIAAFTLASVVCAFALTMAWLIAGRTLQGIAMAARAVVRERPVVF